MFVEKFLTLTAVVVTMSETNIGFLLTVPDSILPAVTETENPLFVRRSACTDFSTLQTARVLDPIRNRAIGNYR